MFIHSFSVSFPFRRRMFVLFRQSDFNVSVRRLRCNLASLRPVPWHAWNMNLLATFTFLSTVCARMALRCQSVSSALARVTVRWSSFVFRSGSFVKIYIFVCVWHCNDPEPSLKISGLPTIGTQSPIQADVEAGNSQVQGTVSSRFNLF